MEKVRLGDICVKQSSKLAQKDLENMDGSYPIFGASGLIKKINTYDQKAEYVAVVKDGAGVGRTMLLPAYSSVIGTLQYLIPNDNVNAKYLYYAVKSRHLEKYYTGSAIPHIYFKDYKSEPIILFDRIAQKKIALVLERVEKIIEKHKQQLEMLDTLIKARFIEMFGDPKSNPNSYPISQLSEHIEFLTSGSRGWAQYCVDNGSEWFITIKNVKGCRISIDNMQPINAPDNAEAKRTKVQEGDLLISITADLGRTGVVTKEIADHGAYINQHLTCIRLNKEMLNPLYVAFFMESSAGKEQFESKNQSAVKAGLNFNSINSLRLLVPPMDEQNAFVGFVHQTDKSKSAIQKSLEKTQTLFDSLMQKYFG